MSHFVRVGRPCLNPFPDRETVRSSIRFVCNARDDAWRRIRAGMRIACLSSVLSGLVMWTVAAQGPSAPAAPNESIVTARVDNAVIIESTTIGVQPPQPLCVLTLRVMSTKTRDRIRPAIRDTEAIVRAYSKDVRLTRLKGTITTAVLTFRGDERSGRLWLVRIDDPKESR